MSKVKYFSIFVLLFALRLQAGGIAGTGVGYVEMNFQYAYSNLSRWITSCLSESDDGKLPVCGTSVRDKETFKKIIEVLNQNRFLVSRIEYWSESEHPEKFNFGKNEPNRIAATELNANSAIMVNVDQLYSAENGRPLLDLPEVVSVLVHELGHQTGEPDHAYLNRLGGQIRFYLGRRVSLYEYDFGLNFELIKMTVINNTYPARSSRLVFSWADQYTKDITKELQPYIKCSDESMGLSGFEFNNGLFIESNNGGRQIEFIFNLRLYCFESKQRPEVIQKKLIRLLLSDSVEIGLKSVRID